MHIWIIFYFLSCQIEVHFWVYDYYQSSISMLVGQPCAFLLHPCSTRGLYAFVVGWLHSLLFWMPLQCYSDGVSRLGLGLETCLENHFSSLDLGLECLRSRLGLEGFRSRSLALISLETLHELFLLWSLARSSSLKAHLYSQCSKFSRSMRSVAKLSLLLYYYGENNLPSTLFKICTEFNKNSVCASETAAHNFCNTCNETLGILC